MDPARPCLVRRRHGMISCPTSANPTCPGRWVRVRRTSRARPAIQVPRGYAAAHDAPELRCRRSCRDRRWPADSTRRTAIRPPPEQTAGEPVGLVVVEQEFGEESCGGPDSDADVAASARDTSGSRRSAAANRGIWPCPVRRERRPRLDRGMVGAVSSTSLRSCALKSTLAADVGQWRCGVVAGGSVER